jgi:FkbM family methyltransferase
MKVIFDVGANNGESTVHYLEDPDTHIYAFEPNPVLVEDIKNKFKDQPRHHIFQNAIADTEGSMAFYLAGPVNPNNPVGHSPGISNWGCSSLLPFSETVHEEWKGREDFKCFATILVDVIRLDTFIKQHGIEKIDYLHVDAQGMDLRDLKSLGSYLSIVKEGVLEAPSEYKKRIYDASHTADEAIVFLKENGFTVTNIEKNDSEGNEVNIYFRLGNL